MAAVERQGSSSRPLPGEKEATGSPCPPLVPAAREALTHSATDMFCS
eukprot:COSAG03_NODE_20384_length_320_cov_0.701357_1_plen_46_part_10